MLPFFLNFVNLSENEKSVSPPSPGDACYQGDHSNPGDRPFLCGCVCVCVGGGGVPTDWVFWLAGWLAAAGASADRISVESIDLIDWQAGRQ